MRLNLYINYYVDSHHHRRQEISFCVINNIANSEIDNVFVLIDESHQQHFKDLLKRSITENKIKSTDIKKITVIKCNYRPTYNDYFTVTQKFSKSDDVSILANTDIFFDTDSMNKIRAFHWKEKYCMALCRYDIIDKELNSKFFDRPDSQDVWIVKGAFETLPNVNYGLGRAGCDNKIAYALQQKFNVINPSLDIITFHLHLTQIRHYISKHGQIIDPLPPPYLQIQPSHLPI